MLIFINGSPESWMLPRVDLPLASNREMAHQDGSQWNEEPCSWAALGLHLEILNVLTSTVAASNECRHPYKSAADFRHLEVATYIT